MFWQKRLDDFVGRLRGESIPARIRLWNGAQRDLGDNPTVVISVPTAAALRHLLNPTLLSLGRAYVEGDIDVEGRSMDIVNVATRLAAHTTPGSHGRRHGPRMIWHTRKIDANAVAYHYDVSNDFYSLWLGNSMVYSCAYFRSPDDSLDDAQMQKIDHILAKLRVRPGDRLLDIGCGWGALIMRAAEKFGARALGITLSHSQCGLARERIAAAGLADRCEVRVEDYRDVRGAFDRIASVGMVEHVGLKNLRGYFAKLRELLSDHGAALVHGITSSDPNSAETPWGGGEFIDRYVFPHGELPHVSMALKELCAAGLEPMDVENLRRHYALTIGHWVERFEAAGERLRSIAGEKRYRIWRVYLAGCVYGFKHDWMQLHQILAVKAGADVLPLTRDYMYGGRAI